MTATTNAALVMRVGAELYGPDAPVNLARDLPMSKRTVERIAKASREGEEYPAARAALNDCARLIIDRLDRLNALLDAVEDAQAMADDQAAAS